MKTECNPSQDGVSVERSCDPDGEHTIHWIEAKMFYGTSSDSHATDNTVIIFAFRNGGRNMTGRYKVPYTTIATFAVACVVWMIWIEGAKCR